MYPAYSATVTQDMGKIIASAFPRAVEYLQVACSTCSIQQKKPNPPLQQGQGSHFHIVVAGSTLEQTPRLVPLLAVWSCTGVIQELVIDFIRCGCDVNHRPDARLTPRAGLVG